MLPIRLVPILAAPMKGYKFVRVLIVALSMAELNGFVVGTSIISSPLVYKLLYLNKR